MESGIQVGDEVAIKGIVQPEIHGDVIEVHERDSKPVITVRIIGGLIVPARAEQLRRIGPSPYFSS
jgi:hypothetical protein